MPVYEYACRACDAVEEHLLRLGEEWAEPCAACGGELRRKFSRVAVRYEGWGFTSTDSLVKDTRGKDFKALRERAERISDE
ncbi:MAG TPA: zinc ribbon domain-containing protein [Mycobacteriales bacterium]|jgi:putative FmdB family regulatory protein